MDWLRFAAEVSDAELINVHRAFEDFLGLPRDQLQDGIHELERMDGFLAIAQDTQAKFLAVRVLTSGECHDLFYVTPATGPARLGFTSSSLSSPPQQLSPWLRAEHRVEKLPSFTALLSLLASQGSAVRDVAIHERQLEAERDYLKQLLVDQSDLLRHAYAELRDTRTQLAQQGLPDANQEEGVAAQNEWNLANLAEWCAEHEGEIVVLPRARNGAKKSRYEDPALIGEALEILAGPYRDFRAGLMNREAFDVLLGPTGLRLAGSVGATIAGEYGDAYFVPWAGRRRFLDFHLLKGGGRDERYCFRLYFFWDDESQRAIVGSMPAHLANSLS